jgi:hypothetical protein
VLVRQPATLNALDVRGAEVPVVERDLIEARPPAGVVEELPVGAEQRVVAALGGQLVAGQRSPELSCARYDVP